MASLKKGAVLVFSSTALAVLVCAPAAYAGKSQVTHVAEEKGKGTLTVRSCSSNVSVTADDSIETAEVTLTAQPASSKKAKKVIKNTKVKCDGANLTIELPENDGSGTSFTGITYGNGSTGITYGNVSIGNGARIGSGANVVRFSQ